MPTENGVFYTLGDWLRRQQGQAQNYAKALTPSRFIGEALDEYARPSTPSLFNDFSAGLQGAPAAGQDVELPKNVGTVEPDGTPSLLKKEPPLGIEQAIEGRAFQPPAPPLTVEQSVAASQPAGQVDVSFGGKTYSYGGGRQGGAPLAGGTLGSLFGREWSNYPSDQTHEFAGEGKGSFSQMTENPELKTLGQLQDETALDRARPASVPGAPKGLTQGEVLDIEKAGAIRAQDPRNIAAATSMRNGAAAAQELRQLEEHLKAKGATADEIQIAKKNAARDLFLSLGFQEGELGALGSYLRDSITGG